MSDMGGKRTDCFREAGGDSRHWAAAAFPKKDREMGIDTMAAYGHLLAAYSESAKTQAE